MSTQHPDNVNLPFFAENNQMGGEDEIQEAYYAFSHLGCDEQMWDYEGKEVDNYVVKKLFTKYESFFRSNVLGKDLFLTMRVPNPEVEKTEAKVLLETLESIPRCFDTAKIFYGEDISPVFEVILPMTTSFESINRVHSYYSKFVVGKESSEISPGLKVADWIGEFKPKNINVIPLFEDKESLVNIDKLTGKYLDGKDISHQRVFLARSDPAMNYGLVGAVLLNKLALLKLHELSEKTGVNVYPIVGVGSAPFRGDLRPETTEQIGKGYPSVHTFSIQSSYKYDNSVGEVRKATEYLQERNTGKPKEMDVDSVLDVVERYSEEYQKQLVSFVPLVNEVAKFVPSRRKRKLHIGLFGYSRSMGEIQLPRAIKFTASMYSLGVPPELLALNALSEKDLDVLNEPYHNFEFDLKNALKYYNPESSFVSDELKKAIEPFLKDVELNEEHIDLSKRIEKALRTNFKDTIGDNVLSAAGLRGFLG